MVSRITTEDFIESAKRVHGNKYDYSKTIYLYAREKVEIICPNHGSFWPTPDNHKRGSGCPKCAIEIINKKNSSNTDEFIKRSSELHNNFYDYSKVEYIKSSVKVCIICPKHGEFLQRPNDHLSGKGCTKCGNEKISKALQKTEDDILHSIFKVHGDLYNYPEKFVRDSKNKISILCKNHGIFKQNLHKHLSGQGCPKCVNNIKSNSEDWIKKS